MRIAALFELQTQVQRLANAESELLVEDSRLKELLPEIKKSRESVPIFARVADALENLLTPNGENKAAKLFELMTLINTIEVKIAAIQALKEDQAAEPLLLELALDKKKEVRQAVYFALANSETAAAGEMLVKAFLGRDREIAVVPLRMSQSRKAVELLVAEGEKYLEYWLREKSCGKDEEVDNFILLLGCLSVHKDPEVLDFLRKCCLDYHAELEQVKLARFTGYTGLETLPKLTADILMETGTEEALELMESLVGKYDNYYMAFSFEASVRLRTPEWVYDHYAYFVKKGRQCRECLEILRVMNGILNFVEGLRISGGILHRTVNNRYNQLACGPKIPFDGRWLSLMIDLDEEDLVAYLAVPGNRACVKYLVRKIESSKGQRNRAFQPLILGLIQAEYPQIVNVVRDILADKSSQYYGYTLLPVLQFLPRSAAEEVEALAGEIADARLAQGFAEVAEFLRRK